MSEELKSERITTMMTPADVKAVDDWSFERRIRSRGDAIRRLLELGLAAESAGEPAPFSKPPPAASAPAPTSADNYAPSSTYALVSAPSGGYPWEGVSQDKVLHLGTDVPARLKAKLKWLAQQFQAAGLPATQQQVITDTLQAFVRRELEAWGVPQNRAD